MGLEPTTLRDLVGCSNHWATGDSMVSEIWMKKKGKSLYDHNTWELKYQNYMQNKVVLQHYLTCILKTKHSLYFFRGTFKRQRQ